MKHEYDRKPARDIVPGDMIFNVKTRHPLANADNRTINREQRLTRGYASNPHHGFWSDADWLRCRDGKFRPVEPGTFPLADGIPSRVGRLRGYGNAIVPQVAAEFIKAFMEAVNE